MTRKKQDAPQRLGGQPDSPDKKIGPTCEDDSIASEEVQSTPQTPPVPASEAATEKATDKRQSHNGSGTMDPSSCDKLLAFTMDFLSKKANSLHAGGNHDNAHPRRIANSSSSSSSGQVKAEKRSRSPDAFPRSGRDVSSSPPKSKMPACTQPNIDAMLSGIDVASLTAANCVAMLQQQFYGQCPNDWIHVQRNDNNCLSKSKAERYRWCVQGGAAGHGPNDAAAPRRHGSAGAGGSPGTVAPGSNNGTAGLKKAQTANGAFNGGQQQDKLFGSVFAGASKFHCRDCGVSFNTLVELTVHMNKTGHFRDSNSAGSDKAKAGKDEHFPLPNSTKMKRPGGCEEETGAEKVLTCMGCGNLFDSLQDLSVHMIKTKHYEKVPSWRIHLGLVNGATPTANESGARKRPTNQTPAGGQQPMRKPEVTSPLVDFSSVLTQSPFYYPLLGAMANPAAYAASLLYSAPWLSPSLLPSLLGAGGAASSSGYPAPFPPGLVPGSFLLPPATSQHPGFKCSECPDSFRSLQELSGHHRRHLNVTSASASPTSSNESSSSSSQKRLDSSSIRPEPGATKAKEENPASGFDFIKSLESTIQSAISKVEAPRSGTMANAKPFTPFSSSINSQTTVPVARKDSKEMSKCHQRRAESPLDLTVKRDSRHPEISAYSGSLPQRDPLECLKENMNSLFSAFRKKQSSTAPMEPPPATTIYQPLIKGNLSTNPLQEMLKIVESAAPESRKDHNHLHRVHPSGKRSLSEATPEERIEPKKSRSSSILHDLIIPRDLPKSSSSLNPIQRMQDLVDSRLTSKPTSSHQPLKSNPSAAFVTSPIFAASPVTSSSASCSPVTSLAAFVSSSRFALPATDNATRKEGAKHVTSSDDCDDVADDESWRDAISKRQELLLQRHHAVFVASHNLKSHSIGDVEVDAMARLTKLPSNVVKDWLRSTSHQRSSVTSNSPFKCTLCSSDKFPGVEDFIKHLDHHLDDSLPQDDAIVVTSSPPQTTSKSALRFQGSLCFSSYRNHVIPSPKRIDDVTTSPATNINPFRHQRDEDDVISVTG